MADGVCDVCAQPQVETNSTTSRQAYRMGLLKNVTRMLGRTNAKMLDFAPAYVNGMARLPL
jgi:hypothetical protein